MKAREVTSTSGFSETRLNQEDVNAGKYNVLAVISGRTERAPVNGLSPKLKTWKKKIRGRLECDDLVGASSHIVSQIYLPCFYEKTTSRKEAFLREFSDSSEISFG